AFDYRPLARSSLNASFHGNDALLQNRREAKTGSNPTTDTWQRLLQSPLRFFNGSGGRRYPCAIAAFFLADVAYNGRVRSAITSQDRKSFARSMNRAPS